VFIAGEKKLTDMAERERGATHRDSFAPQSAATVGTRAHAQPKLIQCPQFSHAVENVQERKESKRIACFGKLTG